jgi:hypothetical protein
MKPFAFTIKVLQVCKKENMKHRQLQFLWVIFIVEFTLRLGLVLLGGTSFLKPSEFIYHFYPMAKTVREQYKNSDKTAFKILILSCSTLHRDWGNFEELLSKELKKTEDSLGLSTKNNVVFSTAGIGFSSADNLNCYRLLADLKFDLVIFYGGINDARFNNCPSEVFKQDYGHLPWNNEINTLQRHTEINYTVLPFFIDYTYQLALQKINKLQFIPEHYACRIHWWKYGSSLKSLSSFEKNTYSILQLAQKKRETLLFISYCFFSPENYSLSNFKTQSLRYNFQTNSRETEIWGFPKNVVAFLNSSNNILQQKYNANCYSLVLPNISSNPDFFADICHFSPSGLSAFCKQLAEEIIAIKPKQP